MTAEPRPAASIILLREGEREPEALMLRRHDERDFGGAWVYPGGLVEADDEDEGWQAHTSRVESEACRLLSLDQGARSYYVAAVRELYEESGLLLAEREGNLDDLEQDRASLVRGELAFSQLCATRGWRLDLDALEYFDYWVTPDYSPQRYATRFFLAPYAEAANVRHDRREATDHRWISPADALAEHRDRRLKLAPPQAVTLERLLEVTSFADALALARARQELGIAAVRPTGPEQARAAAGLD